MRASLAGVEAGAVDTPNKKGHPEWDGPFDKLLLPDYGRPPGLPAGVMPPGEVVPCEGGPTGEVVVSGFTAGDWVAGWVVVLSVGVPETGARPLAGAVAGRPPVLSAGAVVRVLSVGAPGRWPAAPG